MLPPQSLHWLLTWWCLQMPPTASAVFTLPPLLLVLAEAATDTVFAHAPLALVLAEAVAAAVFSPSSHSLVLAEAATTAFLAYPFHRLCRQGRSLAGLLDCRRIWHRSSGQAWCIIWVETTLFALASISLWPSGVRAPPALYFCLHQQSPSNPCDMTSYTSASPPHGGNLCSQRGASTLAKCPCLCVLFCLTWLLLSCKRGQNCPTQSLTERLGSCETVQRRWSSAHNAKLVPLCESTQLHPLVKTLFCPQSGFRLRVGLAQISFQLPVSDLGEWRHIFYFFRWQQMRRVTFVTFLGKMWRSRTRKYFF